MCFFPAIAHPSGHEAGVFRLELNEATPNSPKPGAETELQNAGFHEGCLTCSLNKIESSEPLVEVFSLILKVAVTELLKTVSAWPGESDKENIVKWSRSLTP